MLNMNNNNTKLIGEVIGKPAIKKKKPPRIRNRKRNKCNRLETCKNSEVVQQDLSSLSPSVINNISEPKFNSPTVEVAIPKISLETMQSNKKPSEAASVHAAGKTREQIIAEREAKKQAKQAKKVKDPPEAVNAVNIPTKVVVAVAEKPTKIETTQSDSTTEKSREQIKAEREAKKLAKQASKSAKVSGNDKEIKNLSQELNKLHITTEQDSVNCVTKQTAVDEKKKPALTKAERRAIQESQRAAKAQSSNQKKTPAKQSKEAVNSTDKLKPRTKTTSESEKQISPKKSALVTSKTVHYKVKLFNHLESTWKDASPFVNNGQIHPSIVRLGEQYAKRTVVGSNARCLAFLNALKMIIQDFETPPKKEFSRSLEVSIKTSVDHLQKCRPLAVSVSNAHKHIKHVLTQLPTDKPESELKEQLCHFIDCYIENQIGKAAQAISCSMQEKIKNGDVILTFGCSSLINYICEEAHRRDVDFRVIIVDSRPFCEGQELLRRLTSKKIPCTYVLVNAIGFVMPEVTKVLLGAHALLSNGYVMARTGTAQVALVANSFNVPVLVCCETHKFSERFQTDAIVYNELSDPHDLVLSKKCCLTNWQAKSKMSPLNLTYDITPPELVTAVVTEVSILPCTSVPVILRIKPTEIGYYS